MTTKTLVPFFTLAFALTWGLAGLFLLFPAQITAVFGPVGYTNPLFILAVYAPALAAVFLVWRHHGGRGLVGFLRRFTMWRMPLAWWLFLLAGIPLLFYVGAAFNGTLGDPFPFAPWYGVLPALLTALLIGPIEEIGWRGVALPLLQRRLTPFWASVVLGGVWGVWHVPAFLLGGSPQSAWAFAPFLFAVIALSVIVTATFNASRGSLLIPALFHFQVNGPAWPDAQPWDMLTFGIAAVVIVVLNRKTMFRRTSSATEVIAPAIEAKHSAHAMA